MQVMTLELIADRLAAEVRAGSLSQADADALYAASPFHHQIDGSRDDKIWRTAQPYTVDNFSVEELLDRWVRKSVSFVHRGGPTLDRLHAIGRARVIEVALPLAATTRISEAADNVLDAFAASIGLDRGSGAGANMVAIDPIMPDWIIATHSEGEDRFAAISRGYPASSAPDPD